VSGRLKVKQSGIEFVKLSMTLLCLLATACGPSYAPPGAPSTAYPIVTKARFDAAIQGRATRAEARISATGVVSMSFGMGLPSCSNFKSGAQICKRSNDLAIHYELANGDDAYVLVPKKTDYRLTVNRKPIPCELISRH
jgi:hypothetical protein